MSRKHPKATEKKLPSHARKPSVKAKAAKEAASDSETTKTKKTPKTKGWGKKVAEPAEDSSDGEEDEPDGDSDEVEYVQSSIVVHQKFDSV